MRSPISKRFPRNAGRPLLRAMRAVAHVSQEELAHAAKIHQSDVSFIESGRRDPKPDQAARIARALLMPVEQLFPELQAQARKSESSTQAGQAED